MLRLQLKWPKWLPTKILRERRLFLILVLLSIVAGLIILGWLGWRYFEALKPYLLPAIAALGAMCAAIPGVINSPKRWVWVPAIIGSVFVGWVTWHTSSNLEQETRLQRLQIAKLKDDLNDKDKTFLRAREDLVSFVNKLSLPTKAEFFKSAATIMKENLNYETLTYVDVVSQLLSHLDEDNGHALYFWGEVQRFRKQPELMMQPFYRYLEMEKWISEGKHTARSDSECNDIRGSTIAKVCYDNACGYCMQRTAWIQHLMAQEFYRVGRQATDKGEKIKKFRHACNYGRMAIKNFPPVGFDQGTAPTNLLLERVGEALQALDVAPEDMSGCN